jgi:hypothetical protein
MFDPQPHLIQLPRKVKDKATGHYTTVYDNYLEVKWRLCWFRDRYPHGVITTEEICVDTTQGYARYRATVEDGQGGKATGFGTETAAEFADYCERAETRALGRALAALGVGTQFVGQDLAEMPHVADAPVATTNGQEAASNGQPPPTLTADEISGLLELARSIGVDLVAFGHDMRRVMGLAEVTKVTKKLLRTSMTRPQYETAWQAYSDRLKQQVEQRLAAEDVPDHDLPAGATSIEANGNSSDQAVVADHAPTGASTNGQPEPPPDERLRWGALSRRSMQVGLSATTWEALRQGDYAAAERVIVALEANGHAP